MVAYSFKSSFAGPILAGTKTQTIRNPRKRHARPGEALQLYTGMRTRACKLLMVTTCLAIHEVRLDFANGEVGLDDAVILSGAQFLNEFATSDGFGRGGALRAGMSPWDHMARWWAVTHGQDVFRGVLIKWAPMAEAVQ